MEAHDREDSRPDLVVGAVAAPKEAAASGPGGPEGPEEPEDPEETLRVRSEDLLGRHVSARTFATVGLFVLATFYTLYFARSVVMPMVLAVLLALLLSPIIRGMSRLGVPRWLASAVVLLGFVGAVGYGVYTLAGPVSKRVAEAPQDLQRLERKVRGLKKPVEQVEKATKEVERLAEVGDGRSGTQEVVVRGPTLSDTVLTEFREFVAGAVVLLVLLYFLLASGDFFLRKLAHVLPRFGEKKQAVVVVKQVQRDISTYLLTMSVINIGLGIAVTVTLRLLGLPNAVLWGVMAGFLNFIPYLGPLVGVLIVAVVSLLHFDEIGRALYCPLAYWLLNFIEGSFVTPHVMGARLTLNPVAIFAGVLFWGWIWGIPGALLAVPLMAIVKIVCDHYEPLVPVGAFLGR